MRKKYQNNYKLLANNSLEIFRRDVSIVIEGLALSFPSLTFTTPPTLFLMSANRRTPSAPPLQKILPLVALISSLSNRPVPPIKKGFFLIAFSKIAIGFLY